jgi:hypothetical protein
MARASFVAFSVYVFVFAGTVRAADDPIKAELDEAKSHYEAAMKEVHEGVTKWLADEERSARRRGDKASVDRLKEAYKKFSETRQLPSQVSLNLQRKHDKNRDKLIAAYQHAIKEFTREGKDAEATTAEAELKKLQVDLPSLPARVRALSPVESEGSPWVIIGDELVSNPQERVSHGIVYFGDPTWQDYDLRYKMKLVKPGGYVNSRFHANGKQTFRAFEFGGYDNGAKDLYNVRNGRWLGREGGGFIRPGVEFDRWYDVDIRVRKADVAIYLDGDKIIDKQNNDFQAGRVGFSYHKNAKAAIKDVEVKTPAGDWLWQGVAGLGIPMRSGG